MNSCKGEVILKPDEVVVCCSFVYVFDRAQNTRVFFLSLSEELTKRNVLIP